MSCGSFLAGRSNTPDQTLKVSSSVWPVSCTKTSTVPYLNFHTWPSSVRLTIALFSSSKLKMTVSIISTMLGGTAVLFFRQCWRWQCIRIGGHHNHSCDVAYGQRNERGQCTQLLDKNPQEGGR